MRSLGGGLVRRWIDAAGVVLPSSRSWRTAETRLRARFSSLAEEASGFALWPAGE
jgi:hypothetical protein